MQPLKELNLNNILVTNTKSITHKTAIRKKRLSLFSKCSKQTTISTGKENNLSKKQYPCINNNWNRNTNQTNKKLSNCLSQSSQNKIITQVFQQLPNLQENAIQSLHLLSIDTDNHFAQQSKLLTRWYNQSTDYVLKKQRSVSTTPHKSNNHIFKKKIQNDKHKSNSHPFAYWQLSSQQKLYNFSQDRRLIKNLKDSLLLKDIKEKKRKYRSNLFDFISSKATASKSYFQ